MNNPKAGQKTKIASQNFCVNVLRVIFDSKLQWAPQVANCISKSLSALNAIRLIKKFFTKKELLQLVTSNVFSIWHLPSLKTQLKTKLMNASAMHATPFHAKGSIFPIITVDKRVYKFQTGNLFIMPKCLCECVPLRSLAEIWLESLVLTNWTSIKPGYIKPFICEQKSSGSSTRDNGSHPIIAIQWCED